jgi:hypothetical protein
MNIQNWILFSALCCLLNVSVATSAPIPFQYRFIEVKKIKELEMLPPQLQLIYDHQCNEEFVQVIRLDSAHPKTKKLTVAVGPMVKSNPSLNCKGIKKDQVVDAGIFSLVVPTKY